jgi:hypothetical protein
MTHNGQGFLQVWHLNSVRLQQLMIKKLMMKLRIKVDSYSTAGTEAGICNYLMLQGQAQLS